MKTRILIAFGEPIAHGGQEKFALNEYMIQNYTMITILLIKKLENIIL